ncbi:MAG TPA: flagellar basal body rod protein FlgC [Brevundimonas sp.]|nr:flagellar basal body rod protein FlgC [Brevundimonas sp.]
MDPMKISRSGMDVEWRRMEVIAANLANLNTTRTALGEPFEPLRLVSGPRMNFNAHLAEAAGLEGVEVYGVERTGDAPRRVHEPNHPHADADGYVTYPGIDHAGEMTLLVQTARAYEANLVALNAGRQMYAKALEIGRR